MNATETPWRVKITSSGQALVTDDMGNQIASLSNQEIDHLDAAAIVKAVNQHDALEAAALALDAVLAGTAWHQIEQKALEAAKVASANVEKLRKGKAGK